MSKFNTKDMALLTEVYAVTLLREQAPYMPISQMQESFKYMSETELEYMIESLGSLNEALGGMLSGLGNVGSSIASGAKNLVKGVVPTAKGVGSALAAGAGQLGSNIKQTYQTGQEANKMAKLQGQAQQLVEQLKNLYLQAGHPERDFPNQNVADIINLFDASGYAQRAKDQAAKGFSSGVGGAMKQGFRGSTP